MGVIEFLSLTTISNYFYTKEGRLPVFKPLYFSYETMRRSKKLAVKNEGSYFI